MQRNNTFQMGERLTTNQLYFSAIGLFESSGYNLVSTVPVELSQEYTEGARIYEKNGEYHILYYPGKDNDAPVSTKTRVHPLSTLIDKVDQYISRHDIAKTLNEDKLNKAKKHFLICENNTYLGCQVDHYIYAVLELDSDTFTTDDSIERKYNLSYLIKLFSDKTHHHISRGWQDQLLDTWQCGHYVLKALDRQININNPPKKLIINENMVSEHDLLFRKGYAIFSEAAKKQITSYKSNKINDNNADDDFDEAFKAFDDDNEVGSRFTQHRNSLPNKKQGFFERYGKHIAAIAITWATAGAGIGFAVGFTIGAPFAGIGGLVAGGILAGIGIGVGAAFGFFVGCIVGLVGDCKATQCRPLIKATSEPQLTGKPNHDSTRKILSHHSRVLSKAQPNPLLQQPGQPIDINVNASSTSVRVNKQEEAASKEDLGSSPMLGRKV